MIKRIYHCYGALTRRILFVLLTSACLATSAHATDDIGFVLEDEPIYTSSNPKAPGLLNEIVTELTAILKIHPQTQYLPWKRAQLMTTSTPNLIIFPLTRTEAREESYRWLLPILEVPVMFITKEGSPRVLDEADAAKSRGIGVILGTPQEAYLASIGIPYVALTGETLYPALASGQLNAVYSAGPEAVYAWQQLGRTEKLVFGEPQQHLPLWIATNKASDKVITEDWENALAQLKASGRFDAIVKKYFGTHP